MSIKIYHGYILKDQSVESFQESLPGKRKAFRSEILHLLHEKVASLFVRTCDTSSLFTPESANQDVLSLTQETLKKDVIDSLVSNRKTFFDCEIDLMIKALGSNLLVLYYGPNCFEDQVKRFFGLTEFAYWDNADQPEDVTAEQWAERRKTWGTALLDWASPVDAGFLRASLCSATEIIGMVHDFEITALPNNEERITRCLDTIKRHVVSTSLDSQGGLSYARLKNLEQFATNWISSKENGESSRLDALFREHLVALLPTFDTQHSFSQRYSLKAVDHAGTREIVNRCSKELDSVLQGYCLPG